MLELAEFYDALTKFIPAEARLMSTQMPGDPNEGPSWRWRVKVCDDPGIWDATQNVYACVSAMRQNARGEFRRRKENFSTALCIMIDDLGSGKGAKMPLSLIDALPPTALIETSPDNFQAVYMFDGPVTKPEKFDALVRAFIMEKFLGKDSGFAGINRVFRPPVGINGKPKYFNKAGEPWQVRLAEWHPERRYSIEALAAAFGLELKTAGPRVPKGATVNKSENIRHFIAVRSELRAAGMLKKDEADMAGWMDMKCPWNHEHSGAMDNGAAMRIPDADNSWFGAFKCHHGSCETRGWRELTEWLSEAQEEILEMVNDEAGEWSDYK